MDPSCDTCTHNLCAICREVERVTGIPYARWERVKPDAGIVQHKNKLRRIWKEDVMEKNCINCEHLLVKTGEQPCKKCIALSVPPKMYPKWQERKPDGKVKD